MSKAYRATPSGWVPWNTTVVPAAASVSVAGTSITEGNTGTTLLPFTITLSPASASSVVVNYATSDGTATAGVDYTAASGSVTFAPGDTSKTVNVTVIGDLTPEGTETVLLTVSCDTAAVVGTNPATGTIVDNDTPATLSVSVAGGSVTETDGSTTVNLPFTLTLNHASTTATVVSYATSDGTATAGSDYVAASGSVTFAAGDTTKTVNVTVKGDAVVEATETVLLTISSSDATVIGTNPATGNILDNDATVPTGILYGINTPSTYGSGTQFLNGSPADRLAQYGRVPCGHASYTGDLPSAIGTKEKAGFPENRGQVAFNRAPASIIDGSFDDTITSYAKSIPAGWIIYLTWQHEPNGELKAKQWGATSVADYISAWKHISALLKALPSPYNDGRIRPMINFSAAKVINGAPLDTSWVPTPADMNNSYATMSWDCYGFPKAGATFTGLSENPYRTLFDIYSQMVADTKTIGWNLPYRWGVTEFNTPARIWDRTDQGGTATTANNRAGRIQWFKDVIAYLQTAITTDAGAAAPPHHIFLWEGVDPTWRDFTDANSHVVPAGMNLDTSAERKVFKDLFATSI